MSKGLLPIGTVVRLTGGNKNLMITGYYSKDENDTKIYQYNACIFPDGFIDNTFCLFDQYQIEEVVYKGLENEEFEEYADKMKSAQNGVVIGGSKNDEIAIGSSTKKHGRVPKAPTNPMSISEMRARYTTEKISGGQTETFDFNSLGK